MFEVVTGRHVSTSEQRGSSAGDLCCTHMRTGSWMYTKCLRGLVIMCQLGCVYNQVNSLNKQAPACFQVMNTQQGRVTAQGCSDEHGPDVWLNRCRDTGPAGIVFLWAEREGASLNRLSLTCHGVLPGGVLTLVAMVTRISSSQLIVCLPLLQTHHLSWRGWGTRLKQTDKQKGPNLSETNHSEIKCCSFFGSALTVSTLLLVFKEWADISIYIQRFLNSISHFFVGFVKSFPWLLIPSICFTSSAKFASINVAAKQHWQALLENRITHSKTKD